ncbi:MAG: glycoside hydrolase family 13 protein [Clostridiales bacterium]|nr:glycoside hydrolase family 13 protein [Clostridiales bacterium]
MHNLIKYLEKPEKINLLKKLSTGYLNIGAIFSDESGAFVTPCEPKMNQNVSIKIRVAKNNAGCIYINFDDEKKLMGYFYSDEIFDYYNISLDYSKKQLSYYFTIERGGRVYYFNKRGVFTDLDQTYNFKIIYGFETPDWAKGAVMYQIYVDRFYNGDPSNDVVDNEYLYLGRIAKQIKDWGEPVKPDDICNFYGGDLKGVINKIPYLKEIGIEVIYFNPVFVSPSTHKYDIQDYDYVDPHLGIIIQDTKKPLSNNKLLNRYASMYMERTTDKLNLEASNKLIISLIEIAHQNGIKVILDGVFNHCGAFNKWLDKENFYFMSGYEPGAYRGENSKYHNYFKWYDSNWPNNDCYDGWWGHDNHPKLNFEGSEELYNYILKVGAKWVSPPFNADGWRLDVAADLGSSKEFNHKFWRDFRNSVKGANPEAVILAEHYGDAQDWLQGDQWDTVMNYDAFMEPLTWFLTGMEKHSEEFKPDMYRNGMVFENTMRYFMSRLSYQSLYCSMNQLSNHDHSRFLTRTNLTAGRLHTKGHEAAGQNINLSVMLEAVMFQMVWPGAPAIYYGDEAGLVGWTDPDNRRTFPWGKENKVLLAFHKKIIAYHKQSMAIKKGAVLFLYTNYGILSFARWFGEEGAVVILNNNDKEACLEIPVWKANIKKDSILYQVLATANDTFYESNEQFIVKDGMLNITMPPYSSILLANLINN